LRFLLAVPQMIAMTTRMIAPKSSIVISGALIGYGNTCLLAIA
tara:strand:+ start:216547 stop:216675 length:129 start_codon:yes stop_codon:yes gene_type:complete